TLNYSPSLTGTFTVGGTNPDYTTISAAIDDLVQYGICGPVVLDIRAGTYNEGVVINAINGTSSTNTVTLKGAGAATTTITGHSFTSNAGLGIMGADYIHVQDLSINNTTSGGDVWGVLLTGGADYVTIEACSISVPVGTTIDVGGVVISGSTTANTTEGNNANYFTLKDCYISGGEENVHFEGGGNANPNVGNKVIGCTLVNADDYGFYSDDQDGLELIGNTIGSLVSSTADGIYTVGGYNYTIEKNLIDAPDWGVYLFDMNVNGLAFKASRFVNNMVRSGSDYGVYLNDVDSVLFYHNTIVGEPALYVNDHSNLNIRNNIFSSVTDQAVDFVDATAIGIMDYNLYYNGGVADLFEFGTTTYTNLAAWQTGQSLDANSVEGDPIFVSSTDLHIQGLLANDIGDATVGVTTDIDGDPRPFSPAIDVDMGADEIKILKNDAGITAIEPACVGGDLKVKVINYGALNLQSFTVNWSIDGNLQTPV
ncbi:MAG: right-handed parallel beta-helix repeat-containing protein, partial [Bacteroidota bacterium]|nr:right-handed parallel beta-helix repeat-containing protein [Bacteroidota bacterium]MDX5431443.1 right-handed parallel beta-helix repeat-containing protein [Bacteroidota bacterium]MDX5470171.1 right-handed parallel beta-helix repeat-containing protein [Bacteroidota bacterium]